MSGTKAGGLKAAKTNKEKHGDDFYARIGRIGGAVPTATPKGFAADHQRAVEAGRLGGTNSTRAGIKTGEGKTRRRKKENEERSEL